MFTSDQPAHLRTMRSRQIAWQAYWRWLFDLYITERDAKQAQQMRTGSVSGASQAFISEASKSQFRPLTNP